MSRATGRLERIPVPRSTGYAAVGAAVSGVTLLAVAATLSTSAAFLVGLATFLVAGSVAGHRLSPRAKGQLVAERVDSDCGCNGETKPKLEQQYVAVDPSRRARIVGWSSVGAAVAAAAITVALVAG